MSAQNRRPVRPRKRTILIQCEGSKTEPRYLDDFSVDCGATRRFAIKVKPGKGQNAVVTMEAAIAEGKRRLLGANVYDEVWCVLDVEHAEHEATLTEALKRAKDHGIRVCLSNPSFEVWLLAHFERVTRWFEQSGNVEAHLESAYWKTQFGCEYDKSDPRLYKRLKPLRAAAMENARWTREEFCENKPCRECNASTDVYQLIERVLSG